MYFAILKVINSSLAFLNYISGRLKKKNLWQFLERLAYLQDCSGARSLVGSSYRARTRREYEGAAGHEHSSRVSRQWHEQGIRKYPSTTPYERHAVTPLPTRSILRAYAIYTPTTSAACIVYRSVHSFSSSPSPHHIHPPRETFY